MAACQFCNIVRGDEPGRIVWTAAEAIAFLPLKPAARGHTLVVPKEHVPDLWSVEPPLHSSLMAAVVEVGHGIDKALRPDGMNLISSAGEAASQSVLHLHLHLVPRWLGDHIGSIWPPSGPATDQEQDEIADLLRAALRR
jgi:histidine triad (HIT) family protein